MREDDPTLSAKYWLISSTSCKGSEMSRFTKKYEYNATPVPCYLLGDQLDALQQCNLEIGNLFNYYFLIKAYSQLAILYNWDCN